MNEKALASYRKKKEKIEQAPIPDVVKITWIDCTFFPDGYHKFEELDENIDYTIVEEVGFLIKEDEESYYLAGGICEIRAESKHIAVIPKVSVTEYRLYEPCPILEE